MQSCLHVSVNDTDIPCNKIIWLYVQITELCLNYLEAEFLWFLCWLGIYYPLYLLSKSIFLNTNLLVRPSAITSLTDKQIQNSHFFVSPAARDVRVPSNLA